MSRDLPCQQAKLKKARLDNPIECFGCGEPSERYIYHVNKFRNFCLKCEPYTRGETDAEPE